MAHDLRKYRIGLIVPSSNVTMETELPAMMRARESVSPERFTFHSSRIRLLNVEPEALSRMNSEVKDCLSRLEDAGVDVVVKACLVAAMLEDSLSHHEFTRDVSEHITERNMDAGFITSAHSLTAALKTLGARNIALITPYTDDLTAVVVGYIEDEGIKVSDYLNLSVSDNRQVGRLNPEGLLDYAKELKLSGKDALIISACVQMPSLSVIGRAEEIYGLPVISAATSTALSMLKRLGLNTRVPGAGKLLSGEY